MAEMQAIVNKPILADLHCDLLCYLDNPMATPWDSKARCSIPQLQQGGIALQTLAVFVETLPGSSARGLRQLAICENLFKEHSSALYSFKSKECYDPSRIGMTLAIENASALCDETEPLDVLFQRIDEVEGKLGKIAYISLTWNQENRFGGGALESAPLKPDGKRLLEYLDGKRIAVDLSHTSDQLADDILNTLEHKGYAIPVIASHSNFRKITDVPRNLPDVFVREIERRQGLVGINFYRQFVGRESTHNFVRHLSYALENFSKDILCFGADFFYDEDIPPSHRKAPQELFFPEAAHAGIAYQYVLGLWDKNQRIPHETLMQITFGNLHQFLMKQIL